MDMSSKPHFSTSDVFFSTEDFFVHRTNDSTLTFIDELPVSYSQTKNCDEMNLNLGGVIRFLGASC